MHKQRRRITIGTVSLLIIPFAVFGLVLGATTSAGASQGIQPLASKPKCTDRFIGPGTSWATATNWSARRVPGPTDYACLTSKRFPAVTDASGTIVGLDFANTAGLQNATGTDGILELTGAVPSKITDYQQGNEALSINNPAATLELEGKTTDINGGIGGPGTLIIPSHQTANISPGWSYNGPYGVAAGLTVINQGTLVTDGGCVGNPFGYGSSANEVLEDYGVLEFATGSSEWGTCPFYDGTTMTVTNESSGKIKSLSNSAGFSLSGYVFDNEGSVSVTGATSTSPCSLGAQGCFYLPCSASGCPTSPPSQSGSYSVATGATFVFEGSRSLAATATTSGAGTYFIACGSGTGPLYTDGQTFRSLAVQGTIVGAWTASALNLSSGCLSSGGTADASTGTDTLDGPYVGVGSAFGGSTFGTDIDGPSTFGNLQVSSTATLNNGTLDINPDGSSFTPSLGETFDILNATGGVSGTFGPVNGQCLPALGTDAGYDVQYNATNVTLEVVSSASGC